VRRVSEAQALRETGLTSSEIAERLRVAPSTVRAWLTDPHSLKTRARKHRYGGCCWRCGSGTTGNQPGAAKPLCPTCRAALRRRWTQQLVLTRILEWHRRYGNWPQPSDWHSTRALARGGEAQHRWQEGCWPPATTVTRLFGRFAHAVAHAVQEAPREQ
jgi:hypothetical protein